MKSDLVSVKRSLLGLSVLAIIVFIINSGYQMHTPISEQQTLKYLALGDSYTIGESVPEEKRWPNQLVAKLSDGDAVSFEPVQFIATTGWTTDELQAGIKKVQPSENGYDVVSLLIGVNNQYRGYPIAQFEKEFEELLRQAISYSKNKENVFVVSIPDYGVTPFAKDREPEKIDSELQQYNALSKQIAERHGIAFFDIYDISKKATDDLSYVADDQLHPSGKMYGEWAERVYPWLKKRLAQ